MKRVLSILFIFVLGQNCVAQIADGSTAPDLTLTDYNGTDHNLYAYLNAGKTVFVKIFAAHCPTCWNYHQTQRLKNIYNLYGPDGSDEIMVLALEHDEYNGHDAFIGNGNPWVTQGNWLEDTPYPIFDVEWPDRGVFTDYNVTFYPIIYKICPNRILERVSTSETETDLYQKVEACQASLSVDEKADVSSFYIDPATRSLMLENHEAIESLRIIDLQGRVISTYNSVSTNRISLEEVLTGVYLFQIESDKGILTCKLYVD